MRETDCEEKRRMASKKNLAAADDTTQKISRRDFVRLSSAGAGALGIGLFAPAAALGERHISTTAFQAKAGTQPYLQLLQSWCSGLLRHQVREIQNPLLHGGLLCPSCAFVHGRCSDAVYPLLYMAHTTGESKYLDAALQVYDWSERQVSQPDGSWINDVILSAWKGITVFRVVALAEALHHHGSVLDAAIYKQWSDRLARAVKFLDGFITIETGNVNYPVTSCLAFVLCGQLLGDSHYLDRARNLAHVVMDYFTPNGLLYGEGHPSKFSKAAKCLPVDLGYNVEESLPSLALYSILNNDKPVLDQTITALRTHMEFMLPDGGWDNSWGTRNYKWSWWGSRTSDGCLSAYVLLSQYEPKFLEVAYRNLQMMAACTHEDLLFGGPDYLAHGYGPCIHHTFTHAKAVATVLDRGKTQLEAAERHPIPRDSAYGLKSYPEIATHLAAVGKWRATVTANDWDYVEGVQSGAGNAAGGHVSGGALSILFHRDLGPILVASMTEYRIFEISNQQVFRSGPHMPLTPRIECTIGPENYTSVNDYEAAVAAEHSSGQVNFDVRGRLLNTAHQPPENSELRYHLIYKISEANVGISADCEIPASSKATVQFLLPVVSRNGEAVERPDNRTVRIKKPQGWLTIHISEPHEFETISEERTFDLVPGFECLPLRIPMKSGTTLKIQLEGEGTKTNPA